MTTDNRIINALKSIVPVVVPNVYTGQKLKYIVYNYNTIPALIAEGKSAAGRDMLQIHLYIPLKENPIAVKKQIIEALIRAGTTVPSVTNASDKDGQHYVFECEVISG